MLERDDAREKPSLGEREQAVLDFESRWRGHSGAKERAIREELKLSAARYYQILNAVIETPAATLSDPMLVRQVRAVREARTTLRGGTRELPARGRH